MLDCERDITTCKEFIQFDKKLIKLYVENKELYNSNFDALMYQHYYYNKLKFSFFEFREITYSHIQILHAFDYNYSISIYVDCNNKRYDLHLFNKDKSLRVVKDKDFDFLDFYKILKKYKIIEYYKKNIKRY